jgi:hypothetical protein
LAITQQKLLYTQHKAPDPNNTYSFVKSKPNSNQKQTNKHRKGPGDSRSQNRVNFPGKLREKRGCEEKRRKK